MVRWGDVPPIFKASLPLPISLQHQWSLLFGQDHDVTGGVGLGERRLLHPAPQARLWRSPSSAKAAAPTAQPGPLGKSTVVLIYVGMWLMKTGTRPSVAITKSSVIVKKEQCCLRAQLPFASIFYPWLKVFLKFQEVSEARGTGFS